MEQFKKTEIEDIDTITSYLGMADHKACDYSPANYILWGHVYQTEFTIIDNMLITKFMRDGNWHFTVPMGNGSFQAAMEFILDYCEAHNIPFLMHMVEPEMADKIEQLYPDKFLVNYNRDSSDYVYLAENLIQLTGKKYHGKKNHINKFKKNHPDWLYEPMTDENMQECVAMTKAWCVENNCCEDEEKAAEICILVQAIENRTKLHLIGGIIRTSERIVGLTMGEPCSKDSFVIHFEKAFASEQGAYPMINQQFALHELSDYTYINREEDMGIEGLRKAKESYYPTYMVEKGILSMNS